MAEDVTRQATIVGDSGPLIALAIINQLDLLRQLYRNVIVPQAVWDEITIAGAGLPGANDVRQLEWVEVRQPDASRIQPLTILVDRGEAEAIALAMLLPNATVLLDDAQARRVAERFGVPRIGTLGILRRAKRFGYLTTIKPLIAELQANGIYIRQTLLDALLRDVGEY